ncbi:prolyl 4-hydroxylase subunit alpha-3-like [Macrobrachium nipponense]|uniref:prolyl 4-hydroxylase subunit alpha-3-like n=1 Tax=Macrobrachium nipponense TaxID=159736 RepID=UPI0030C86477
MRPRSLQCVTGGHISKDEFESLLMLPELDAYSRPEEPQQPSDTQLSATATYCSIPSNGHQKFVLHLMERKYSPHAVSKADQISTIHQCSVAIPFLKRSLVQSSDSPVEYRVSHTAWLREESHPVLPKIVQRISDVTGLYTTQGPLNNTAAEDLQVLSYGIGGHYFEHEDYFWKGYAEETWPSFSEKYDHYPSGDRMATWMFYLSDVEAGGRTAFPKAGVSVVPVKGSAVFWYNIKKNGVGNAMSQHGGCPVLLGHKWVANKWIRENWNFQRRPCSLNPDD